jgi:small subunit ribosomal protein S11
LCLSKHLSTTLSSLSRTKKDKQFLGLPGKMGFRGSKKNTPYASQQSATDAAKVAYEAGLRKVAVRVKGPGAGRDAAVRAINAFGIEVTEIRDTTPQPHNGCRPPKQRRV